MKHYPDFYIEDKNEKRIVAEAKSNWQKAQSQATSILQDDSMAQLASDFQKLVRQKKYIDAFCLLTAIVFLEGRELVVTEPVYEGMGDVSRVSIKGIADNKIWDHLKIENSPMGAWQTYILYKIEHILPFFWHGGYAQRSFIYNNEDLLRIYSLDSDITGKDHLSLAQRLVTYDIKPKVLEYNGKYYISCCFWSDWGGLIRECIEMTFKDRMLIQTIDVNDETLYKYNCGILF